MLVNWLDKTSITTNDMTTEGLANLKKVLRKAIELQVDAVLVMATLQSIYCDEEDGLDQDAEEYLHSAMGSARSSTNFTMSLVNQIQKAYVIEKGIESLNEQLGNKQSNDEE